MNSININDWYTTKQAATRLTANSGKPIKTCYVRTLARYGKLRTYRISEQSVLYFKEDVDDYVVEERGEKTARSARQKALEKGKPTKDAA